MLPFTSEYLEHLSNDEPELLLSQVRVIYLSLEEGIEDVVVDVKADLEGMKP
jgi:hypothetical protein